MGAPAPHRRDPPTSNHTALDPFQRFSPDNLYSAPLRFDFCFAYTVSTELPDSPGWRVPTSSPSPQLRSWPPRTMSSLDLDLSSLPNSPFKCHSATRQKPHQAFPSTLPSSLVAPASTTSIRPPAPRIRNRPSSTSKEVPASEIVSRKTIPSRAMPYTRAIRSFFSTTAVRD